MAKWLLLSIALVLAVTLGVGAGFYLAEQNANDSKPRTRSSQKSSLFRAANNRCLRDLRREGMSRPQVREACSCIMEEVRQIVRDYEASGDPVRDIFDIEEAVEQTVGNQLFLAFDDCIEDARQAE